MKHGLLLLFLIAAFAGSLALPQTAPPAAKKPKTSTTKTSPAKTATTGTSAKKTSAKKKSTKSGKKAPAVTRQMAPTPERYKEIQQALIDRGYLKSEPTGVWDEASSAAMAQFQTERNLPATGKLTAASLIALGLGPSSARAAPAAPASIPVAPSGDPPHTPAN